MPKRKRKNEELAQIQRSSIYKKEEIMVETVRIILKYNIHTGIPSNDMTLIEHAKTLNVDELIQLNNNLLKCIQ